MFTYANFQQYPFQQYISNVKKSLSVSPEAPFYWKLLKIGQSDVKDIRKKMSLSLFYKFVVPPLSPSHTACNLGSFTLNNAIGVKNFWTQYSMTQMYFLSDNQTQKCPFRKS